MTDLENKPAETEITEEKEVTEEPQAQETTNPGHKASRGEKKFKKSLTKMGLKPVPGVTRVTLKTTKNFLLYIDDPDVLKSTDNAYVIFGEAKFHDYTGNLGSEKAQNFKQAEEVAAKNDDKPEVQVEDDADNDGDEDQGDLNDDQITTLMEYSGCTRNRAIKALKKTNGDVVEAITLAS